MEKGWVAPPKCSFHVATQTEKDLYTLIEQSAHLQNCGMGINFHWVQIFVDFMGFSYLWKFIKFYIHCNIVIRLCHENINHWNHLKLPIPQKFKSSELNQHFLIQQSNNLIEQSFNHSLNYDYIIILSHSVLIIKIM